MCTCTWTWIYTRYCTDVLISLLDSVPHIQNHVSQLCEGWWCARREGRESLIPNTLLYVVARTLTEGATVRERERYLCMYDNHYVLYVYYIIDSVYNQEGTILYNMLACTLYHVIYSTQRLHGHVVILNIHYMYWTLYCRVVCTCTCTSNMYMYMYREWIFYMYIVSPQHADVKRVWLVREAFVLLDFEDPTTEPFKTMLLSCTLQHAYLNSDEVSLCTWRKRKKKSWVPAEIRVQVFWILVQCSYIPLS